MLQWSLVQQLWSVAELLQVQPSLLASQCLNYPHIPRQLTRTSTQLQACSSAQSATPSLRGAGAALEPPGVDMRGQG